MSAGVVLAVPFAALGVLLGTLLVRSLLVSSLVHLLGAAWFDAGVSTRATWSSRRQSAAPCGTSTTGRRATRRFNPGAVVREDPRVPAGSWMIGFDLEPRTAQIGSGEAAVG
jgi:hypothetical protein